MIQSVILNLQTMWSRDKGSVAHRDSIPLIYFHSSGCLDAHNKSPYRPGMLIDDRFARWSPPHICREYDEKERWMGSSPSVWPLVTLRAEIYWNGWRRGRRIKEVGVNSILATLHKSLDFVFTKMSLWVISIFHLMLRLLPWVVEIYRCIDHPLWTLRRSP